MYNNKLTPAVLETGSTRDNKQLCSTAAAAAAAGGGFSPRTDDGAKMDGTDDRAEICARSVEGVATDSMRPI